MKEKLHSHRGESGQVLRGDKLGKIDFGQVLEWVGRTQIQNEWIMTDLKLLDVQGRMTGAVAAVIATIVIIVLLKRGTGTFAGCGILRR